MVLKIVHTADIHLDMPLTALPPEKARLRRAERRKSFVKILTHAKSVNADALLISGDLFDSPFPSRDTVSFCVEELKRVSPLPVFIALGNHDYSLSDLDFPGNVRVFPKSFAVLPLAGADIYGASFSSETALLSPPVPSDTSKINLLCLHGDLFSGGGYNPLEMNSLLPYDYAALGHVHTFFQKGRVVYPGCHDGGGFDECGTKGFVEADIEKDNLKVKFIPSSSEIYDILSLDVSPYVSSASLGEEIASRLDGGIYKIALTGVRQKGFTPDLSLISSYISEKSFYFTLADASSASSSSISPRLLEEIYSYIDENLPESLRDKAKNAALSALSGDSVEIWEDLW